ncbi:MAG: hypothetical protein ACFFD1_14325 [Candidatus Thorarchaeota archaeon]
MISCESCGKTFGVESSLDWFNQPLIHNSNEKHFILFNNKKILLENLIRLIVEEDISAEESGENLAIENPLIVPCFLCDTRGLNPCICPMCNVVLCDTCYNDHDQLIIESGMDHEIKYLDE